MKTIPYQKVMLVALKAKLYNELTFTLNGENGVKTLIDHMNRSFNIDGLSKVYEPDVIIFMNLKNILK